MLACVISKKNTLSAGGLRFRKDTKEVKRFLFLSHLIFFLVYLKALLHKLNRTLKSFSQLPRGLKNSTRNVFMNVEAQENLKIQDSMLNISGCLSLFCLNLYFTVHNVFDAIGSV